MQLIACGNVLMSCEELVGRWHSGERGVSLWFMWENGSDYIYLFLENSNEI